MTSLINEYYLSSDVTSALRSVDAPFIVKSGMNPHSRYHRDREATYYVKKRHRLVPEFYTVAGVTSLIAKRQNTPDRITAIKAEAALRKAEDDAILAEMQDEIAARREYLVVLENRKAEEKQAATKARLEKLNEELAKRGAPPLNEIERYVYVHDVLGYYPRELRAKNPRNWADVPDTLARAYVARKAEYERPPPVSRKPGLVEKVGSTLESIFQGVRRTLWLS